MPVSLPGLKERAKPYYWLKYRLLGDEVNEGCGALHLCSEKAPGVSILLSPLLK